MLLLLLQLSAIYWMRACGCRKAYSMPISRAPSACVCVLTCQWVRRDIGRGQQRHLHAHSATPTISLCLFLCLSLSLSCLLLLLLLLRLRGVLTSTHTYHVRSIVRLHIVGAYYLRVWRW